MPTIGVADVLIVPKFSKLQQTVGRELDGVSTSAGKSSGSKMGAALGGALKVGALAAGGAVIGGLGLALTKGFGRLQAIENAKAKLTGLGHSAESVTVIMNNAMASVKGTAFGLGDAATVAANMVAAGVKPGKDLQKTLTLIGDAATIAGTDMGSMGAIFGKAAASNKVQMDVINQLHDAGVPALALLAKQMGVTAEEASVMASKGKIDFATFQTAMEKGLGGAAQESGKTLEGAFKNTIAAVGRIGANLLSGVYPKIQQFFAGAITWLKPLEDGAKVAGAVIGDFLNNTISAAKGVTDILFKGDFTGGIFGLQEDSGFVDFLFRVRDGVIGIYDAVVKGDFSAHLRDAFGVEEDSKFVDFLFSAREVVIGLASFVVTDLLPGLQNLGKWIVDNIKTIGIVAGVVAVLLIPALIRWGVEATIAGVKNAAAWLAARAGSTQAAAMYVVNSYKMIGTWVAMGLAAIKSGAQTAAIWLMYRLESAKSVAAMLVAKTVMVASWVVMGVQAMLAGAKIAAGWVLAMGPVGWIIGGIALLVGGFILAYNKLGWFKDGVNAVLKAVGGFFVWLWENAIKPAFDGIMTAASAVASWFKGSFLPAVQFVIGAIGAAFTWWLNTIVRPVFSSVFTIVNGFYLFFRGIFQLVVSVFVNILAPAFMNFWHGVVEPVFAAIGLLIGLWWTTVSGIFMGAVNFIKTVLGAVFTWFRDSVIKPVFSFIVASIAAWWTLVSGTFNTAVSFIKTTLGNAFTWFRDFVITPVFNFIRASIATWWALVSGTFNAVTSFIRGTLASAFTWLRDSIISPVFNSVRDTIKNVWEKGIKPVFDFISNAIKNDVPAAFQKGVDGIKKIWDTMLGIAKAPVRFVVDTVINDGLIGAFNTVAGFLPGIDKLARVALPKGFASGGWTGPGSKYQPAGVVHADEFVVNKASRRAIEGRAPGLLDSLNQFGARALGMLGYANGGRVWPTKDRTLTQGYSAFHDGIDIGVPSGTPVFATGPGTVDWAGPGVQLPGIWGGNEIHILGDGFERWFGHLSQIGVKIGQKVSAGQQIGLSGNTGITSGPHLHFGVYAGGYPNSVNPLSYLDGAAAPKGGGGGGWLDPLGAIRGLADKVVGQVKGKFPAGGFMIDAVTGIGKKLIGGVVDWVKGKFGMGGVAGAANGAHLDPLLYDQGGILRPGLSNIVNATGRPEAILNPQQWADIHHLATLRSGGSGMTYSPTYQWAGDDPHVVMAKDKARMRDTFNAFNL